MKRKATDSKSVDGERFKQKRLPSAKSKVVSLLARREHSQQELKAKLTQRGYTDEEASDAIRWAASHQFQSDERFALSLFRRRASTFGDRAIHAELGQHGLSSSQLVPIDTAEPVCEIERAMAWIKRRKAAALHALQAEHDSIDSAELLKIKSSVFRALGSRGFEFSHIDQAWRRILGEFNSNA